MPLAAPIENFINTHIMYRTDLRALQDSTAIFIAPIPDDLIARQDAAKELGRLVLEAWAPETYAQTGRARAEFLRGQMNGVDFETVWHKAEELFLASEFHSRCDGRVVLDTAARFDVSGCLDWERVADEIITRVENAQNAPEDLKLLSNLVSEQRGKKRAKYLYEQTAIQATRRIVELSDSLGGGNPKKKRLYGMLADSIEYQKAVDLRSRNVISAHNDTLRDLAYEWANRRCKALKPSFAL